MPSYAASNAGLLASLGTGNTNTIANDAQLSSSEPSPISSSGPPVNDEVADNEVTKERPTDTSGTSARSQAPSVVVSPTVTDASITASALPVAMESILTWTGRILEIEDGIFTAELTPMYHAGPIVLGDFELADLDADDLNTVREGDLFYLSVTRIRQRGNRTTKSSDLLLRRLGRWSAEDVNLGTREARSELTALEDNVD